MSYLTRPRSGNDAIPNDATHTHARIYIYIYPRYLKINACVHACAYVCIAGARLIRMHRVTWLRLITQCQWLATRTLFGSRSTEGVHPAYVVNTLTILHEANGSVSVRFASFHLSRIRRRKADERVCLCHYNLRTRGQEASLLIATRLSYRLKFCPFLQIKVIQTQLISKIRTFNFTTRAILRE